MCICVCYGPVFEVSVHMLNSFYRQVYFLPVGKANMFQVSVAYSDFSPFMTVCVTK